MLCCYIKLKIKISKNTSISPESVITAREIVHENRTLHNPVYEEQNNTVVQCVDMYNVLEEREREHNGIYNTLHSYE